VVAGPRGDAVRFNVRVVTRDATWGMNGDHPVDGDLAGTLRRLAEQAGKFRLKVHAERQR
jgi:hypothetical protein